MQLKCNESAQGFFFSGALVYWQDQDKESLVDKNNQKERKKTTNKEDWRHRKRKI